MKNKEQIISETLVKIGVPIKFKGFPYLKEAVSKVLDDPMKVHGIHNGLYEEIAKKFGTKGSRVERGIRYGIEVAWTKTPLKTLEKIFSPYIVNREKLTNTEFIALLAERLQLDLMQKAG